MSETTTNSASAAPDATVPNDVALWRGMTLDELRRARAKALIKREVGRAALQYDVDGVKNHVAANGVRALMFRPGTVSRLKTADYVLLGFRLAKWIVGLNTTRRRRRR